jgi:Holliday junction resolvase
MAEEKQFENKIKDYLRSRGAWVFKVAGGGFQRSGIPDLLCCLNGKFLAIEVKAERGKPSDLQLWNIEKIRQSGGVACVLYPHQWEEFKDMIEKSF